LIAKPDSLNNLSSNRTIAKNTFFNLVGYTIPLAIAIVLIPPLINGLGEERFGILNLIWIVIGYFSFFDFGIGKTLTKIMAEKIGLNKEDEIPGIFWTSIFLMAAISFLGAIILILLIPVLVNNFFNISYSLRPETLKSFYMLTLSIPFVTTTAGFRGVLEAYQSFKVINILRIALGVLTFFIPLFCLIFSTNLFWIVTLLVLMRIGIWILYLLQCFKINNAIQSKFRYSKELILPVLKMSGWITIANVVGPIIIYLDRFFIGGLISASAVTYYATPYEVVTKLWVIPTALVSVLFPIFSSSYTNNPELSKKLFSKGIKFIFLFLYPIVFLLIVFSREGMGLWLGEKFSHNSSLILQMFSIGILINSIAYIPFHFFQGIGKPDIPAKINLLELPIYIFLMWFFTINMGIIGAAMIWLFRVIVDAFILFFIANKTIQSISSSKISILIFTVMILILISPIFINNIILKLIFAIIIVSSFFIATWKFFLNTEEKTFFITKLKLIEK
jgi:O-antigen/teichoic acid export membrane protein